MKKVIITALVLAGTAAFCIFVLFPMLTAPRKGPVPEDASLWDHTMKTSRTATKLLFATGAKKLISDPSRNEERMTIIGACQETCDTGKLITLGYLESIDPELPAIFAESFIAAFEHWKEALETKDTVLADQALAEYQVFLKWATKHKPTGVLPKTAGG